MAGLGDPDAKCATRPPRRLEDRADALPWLRRAARAADEDTGRRAAELLAPHEKRRQEAVAKAIDACVRDGRIDVLTEWHQYWKPRPEEDLWEVGPRATKAGLDLYVKSCSKDGWEVLEKGLDLLTKIETATHDGPYPERFAPIKRSWLIRTDRLDGRAHVGEDTRFASGAGPARLPQMGGGRFLVLGPVEAGQIGEAFVAADGGIRNQGMRAVVGPHGASSCAAATSSRQYRF